jgi:hypothetical protein
MRQNTSSENEPKIQAQLVSSGVIDFHYFEVPPDYTKKQPREETYFTECGIAVKHELDGVVIRIRVSVTPRGEETLIVGMTTITAFEVPKMKDYIKNNELIVPESFWGALISTSVSTLRGYLQSKMGDTPLSPMILPLIDIKSLIPTESFKLQGEPRSIMEAFKEAELKQEKVEHKV